MGKRSTLPILSTPAYLWDNSIQLGGTLELWESEIRFQTSELKGSPLNLYIPLEIIETIEEFLIFDIAKNGLRIQNIEGKNDLFVLDQPKVFKDALNKVLENMQ